MSKDESEYTVPPEPVEPERRRLVVNERSPDDLAWISVRPVTKADVEAWAASHGLALVRAGNLDYDTMAQARHDAEEECASLRAERDAAIKRAEKAEARVVELSAALRPFEWAFTRGDTYGNPPEQYVSRAHWETAAAQFEDQSNAGLGSPKWSSLKERAEKAEADREKLLWVVRAAWRDSRSWSHLEKLMHALPEHIRREL